MLSHATCFSNGHTGTDRQFLFDASGGDLRVEPPHQLDGSSLVEQRQVVAGSASEHLAQPALAHRRLLVHPIRSCTGSDTDVRTRVCPELHGDHSDVSTRVCPELHGDQRTQYTSLSGAARGS